jgi:glycosyltransferase involved in cell wall biosynthesis
MRILAITEYYRDEGANGSEVFCREAIDRLRKRHDIDVLARRPRAESGRRRADLLVDDAVASDLDTFTAWLETELQSRTYDVIYSAGALFFGCRAVAALAQAGIDAPIVNHFQALLGPYARAEGLDDARCLQNDAGQRDAVETGTANIFISQAEARAARDSGMNVERSLMSVIPNGIDMDPFRTLEADESFLPESKRGANRPFVIATAGRFSDFTKGADLVYRAFAELRRRHDDVFLVSIGNSHRFSYLLRDLPSDSYALVDWQNRASFLGKLAAANLAVLPSRYEPFGLIAIEALACGVPVIATAVGGFSETVHHGVTGYLSAYEEGSFGILAAMEEALANRRRLPAMGRRGRRFVRSEYDIRRVVTLIDRELRRVSVASTPLDLAYA